MKVTDMSQYMRTANMDVANKINKNLENKKEEEASKIGLTQEQIAMQEEDGAVAELSEFVQERLFFLEELDKTKEQLEASEESWSEFGKMLEIARRLSKGDRVPALDEKKLMEFDRELYMKSKMMGIMAKNKDAEEHESLFEDENDIEEQVREITGDMDVEIPYTESSGGSSSAEVSVDVSTE